MFVDHFGVVNFGVFTPGAKAIIFMEIKYEKDTPLF
tara:strand:- start:175 stop:282 length:108 start_codon:yes stop_codon:yes gene_type:complete